MAGPVGVREAGAEEAPALAALHLDTALHAYAGMFPPDAPVPTLEDTVDQWRAWLAPGGDTVAFVAESAAELIGVVLAGSDQDRRACGHLSRLYVRPDRWGEGIGRRLHDTVLDHLAGRGFPQASLWVLERNARVRAWYERLGWTATGETKPVWEPGGIVDVGYIRPLT